MTGRTLDLNGLIQEDQLGARIADQWVKWSNLKSEQHARWKEVSQYLFATDTTHTTNSKNPWSNTTTLPKLTQIRDNLYANYIATMFPRRRWLSWEGLDRKDEEEEKVKAVKDYMLWAVGQPDYKTTVSKLVLDYIDYGNCFATSEWVDETFEDKRQGSVKIGYAGPKLVRIPPQDICFNPTAPSFAKSPKIIRSLMSMGEAKETLDRMATTTEDKELASAVWQYCLDFRDGVMGSSPDASFNTIDERYLVDGFGSYRQYLESDLVELLTFYGDLYDRENKVLLKNHVIVVIDRHKIALKKIYPFPIADIPIRHAGWRVRQDNLWAMGPLENLVGLQYRLDHIENMKSDVLDLIAYPPIKIKGSGAISDFTWGPMERIYCDTDGDVELMSPDVQALQPNIEIARIEQLMEEMAGSPKEAMGFRTPGEKTAFEVERMENAWSRIFQNKIAQLEEALIETTLNDMLLLARENLSPTTVRTIGEFGVVGFEKVTREDLSANGRLKPIAARHFAEQSLMIQNLNNWSQGPLGQDPTIKVHFSGVKLAEMIEDVLNLQDYELMIPYVGVSEALEAQKLQAAGQEGAMAEMMTPTGLTPDDYSDPSNMEAISEQEQTSSSLA